MVQLPATAAIVYVAACWVSWAGGIFLSGGAFVRGVFCPGGLLSGGLTAYARSPQVQCVYGPSRLSVPSNRSVTDKKNKKTNKKTRMVQLPATAAIEYVNACCITRTRTITKTKTKTKTETRTKIRTITKIVPGCLCPFPPSSMLIRTV